MSRRIILNFDGLPAGVAAYVAAHRLPVATAEAAIAFVRGLTDFMPDGLECLRVILEAWRGEYIGRRTRTATGEMPDNEYIRLRNTYGGNGLWRKTPAQAFNMAFQEAASERTVR
jgi:hypothetical protein